LVEQAPPALSWLLLDISLLHPEYLLSGNIQVLGLLGDKDPAHGLPFWCVFCLSCIVLCGFGVQTVLPHGIIVSFLGNGLLSSAPLRLHKTLQMIGPWREAEKQEERFD
jgi:hypothetical protein